MPWLLIAAALLARAAEAQLSQTSEKIEVNIIEVDVVVLDAQGKPVRGLSSNDFELRVGGRRRTITNFYEVNRRAAESSAAATKNAETALVARRDYVVLFIDDLHLNQHEKKRALDALRSFVQQHVRSGTAAMLVASDGDVRILQKFTEDPSLLLRAIDGFEAKPTHVTEYETQRRQLLNLMDEVRKDEQLKKHLSEQLPGMIDSLAQQGQFVTEHTIDALHSVASMMAGLDGRRVLVYVSDGLPMQPGTEIFPSFPPEEFLPNDSSEPTFRIIAQSLPMDA